MSVQSVTGRSPLHGPTHAHYARPRRVSPNRSEPRRASPLTAPQIDTDDGLAPFAAAERTDSAAPEVVA